MSAYTVLITRKISPALVKKAKEQDVELREIEFIEVVACEETGRVNEVADQPCTVAFTSKHSVKIVSSLLDGKKTAWKIFCVDGATRDHVAENFGEHSIAGTADNAEGLASLIVEKDLGKQVVFFCGDKRRDELPQILQHHDIAVEEVIVYETRLSPEEIGEHFDGIAFFSPSAVDSFFSVNVADYKTVFFSIGSTTSESLKKFVNNKIITCEKASEDNMVDTILSYIKNNNE